MDFWLSVNTANSLEFCVMLTGYLVYQYQTDHYWLQQSCLTLQHGYVLVVLGLLGFLLRTSRALNWYTLAQLGSDLSGLSLVLGLWLLAFILVRLHVKCPINLHTLTRSHYYMCLGLGCGTTCIFVVIETLKLVYDSLLWDAIMMLVFATIILICVVMSGMGIFMLHEPDLTTQLRPLYRSILIICLVTFPLLIWRVTDRLHRWSEGESLLVPDDCAQDHFSRCLLSFSLMALFSAFVWCIQSKKSQKPQKTTLLACQLSHMEQGKTKLSVKTRNLPTRLRSGSKSAGANRRVLRHHDTRVA